MTPLTQNSKPLPTLEWTGERMIPHKCDPLTEMFHWQRYLFFRPWYEDKKVVDAASGEGYGANYQSVFATEVIGVDVAEDAANYASKAYEHVSFEQADVCEFDYSGADLVTSFETIEHLPDPTQFLKALAKCKGAIVISTPNRNTHSPGNKLADKPVNPHHTIEWMPAEFAELIKNHFPKRTVRFLSQAARWPGTITEGLEDDAMYTIAVIDGGELPTWPSVGLAMPTVNGADRVADAILGFTKFYPGSMKFVVVANGSSNEALAKLRTLQAEMPHLVDLVENETNEGYGKGANAGLAKLQEEGFELYGVTNDDV